MTRYSLAMILSATMAGAVCAQAPAPGSANDLAIDELVPPGEIASRLGHVAAPIGDGGLQYYTLEIRAGRNPVENLRHRANVWRTRHEWQLAIDDYSAVLQIDPHNAPALIGRGRARYLAAAVVAPASDFDTVVKQYQETLNSLSSNLKAPDKSAKDLQDAITAFLGKPTTDIQHFNGNYAKVASNCSTVLKSYQEAVNKFVSAVLDNPNPSKAAFDIAAAEFVAAAINMETNTSTWISNVADYETAQTAFLQKIFGQAAGGQKAPGDSQPPTDATTPKVPLETTFSKDEDALQAALTSCQKQTGALRNAVSGSFGQATAEFEASAPGDPVAAQSYQPVVTAYETVSKAYATVATASSDALKKHAAAEAQYEKDKTTYDSAIKDIEAANATYVGSTKTAKKADATTTYNTAAKAFDDAKALWAKQATITPNPKTSNIQHLAATFLNAVTLYQSAAITFGTATTKWFQAATKFTTATTTFEKAVKTYANAAKQNATTFHDSLATYATAANAFYAVVKNYLGSTAGPVASAPGNVQLSADDAVEIIADLKQALLIEPRAADAYGYLADAQLAAGKSTDAQASYDEAIRYAIDLSARARFFAARGRAKPQNQ